jgi:hypothetical protein
MGELHLTRCPLCGRKTSEEALAAQAECDYCFDREYPGQISAEEEVGMECAKLGHPLIHGGCECGKVNGAPLPPH